MADRRASHRKVIGVGLSQDAKRPIMTFVSRVSSANISKFIFIPLEFQSNQIIFTDIYHFITDIIGDWYDFGNEKRQSEKTADP
jgi:hypothetical protein